MEVCGAQTPAQTQPPFHELSGLWVHVQHWGGAQNISLTEEWRGMKNYCILTQPGRAYIYIYLSLNWSCSRHFSNICEPRMLSLFQMFLTTVSSSNLACALPMHRARARHWWPRELQVQKFPWLPERSEGSSRWHCWWRWWQCLPFTQCYLCANFCVLFWHHMRWA